MRYLLTWKVRQVPPQMAKVALALLKASDEYTEKLVKDGIIKELWAYADGSGGGCIGEGDSHEDAYKAMKILNENDVFSHAMFVIGSRRDTYESIEELRRYSSDLGPDFAIFTALTPFPGTIHFEQAKKYGWIEDFNYSNYDMAHAIMDTKTLSRSEVQHELWKCYKNFYGSYRRNISGIFSSNKLKRTLYRHMAGQHVLPKLRRLI